MLRAPAAPSAAPAESRSPAAAPRPAPPTRGTGGNQRIYPCCGKDCTVEFDVNHGARATRQQDDLCYIGELA